MGNVRAETYKAIRDNDLSSVVFADPFSSVTRSAKRNLLIAAFVALMIAVLQLEITGFLGLQASNANLGNPLAQGIACLIVSYLLISAIFHIFADYTAWQFQRERQVTQPYLDLITLFESRVSVTEEQIRNACSSISGIVVEGDMRAQVEFKKDIDSAVGQLKSINSKIGELIDEVMPLLENWATTIRRMNRLEARLRMRMLSLWALDILFPLLLGGLAVWVTSDGVSAVIMRIIG